MLPPIEVLLEAARSANWHAVLGIQPGTTVTPKQARNLRAQVHPDKGHSHEVAAAVAQALDELAQNGPQEAPYSGSAEPLIEELNRAVRREPVNSAGGRELRRLLDALVAVRFEYSPHRLQYYYRGWGTQAEDRCYVEILRIWPAYNAQIKSDPLRARAIGLEFLAQAVEIDAFQDALTESQHRISYAKSWVQCAEHDAQQTPVAMRHRKTLEQRMRRAGQRENSTSVSEAEALAAVLEHCEPVTEARLATPLGTLRTALRTAGVSSNVTRAAGISTKTRRQHRPLQGESFYYATVMSAGKRVAIRLKVSST